MRAATLVALLVSAAALCATSALAQPSRNGVDVIWARQAPAAVIKLDGVLDEPAWAQAESKLIRYTYFAGDQNGIPGSGYQEEGGKLTSDSTFALVKFLVVGNTLYMGADMKDKSVGGGPDFNRFDGLLMSIKDHLTSARPSPMTEFFYSWWYPDTCDHNPSAAGKQPDFRGRWGNRTPCTTRPQWMIDNWNAATYVHGLTNSDAVNDTGYTVEMAFKLDSLGYHVNQAGGDVVEFNISIYDTDWYWPQDLSRFSSNRTWWQCPWGLDNYYHQVQIWSRPDVTISSGPVPQVPPDIQVGNSGGFATPVIDGVLNDAVWAAMPGFDIRYGDDVLRGLYPSVLKWRSGQFQPTVNGGVANVIDPGDATVKMFFKADTLYLGFDVRDQFVQNYPIFDRWDGVVVNIDDRVFRWRDRNLMGRNIAFQVGPTGAGVAQGYLIALRDTLHAAKFALSLKPNTTVDTVGADIDEGYQAELAIDLTKLGYPSGRGDGILFIGVDLIDGDSFQLDPTLSYAERTWFGREGGSSDQQNCCVAWAYMNPNVVLDAPVANGPMAPFGLLGNFPNPARAMTMIRYAMDGPGEVTLEVFDLQGRLVASRPLGFQSAGTRQYAFTHPGLGAGLYLYRMKTADALSGEIRTTRSAKMLLLK